MNDFFRQVARKASEVVGSPWAFIVGAWAVSGPLFGFSDTWQLVINTHGNDHRYLSTEYLR